METDSEYKDRLILLLPEIKAWMLYSGEVERNVVENLENASGQELDVIGEKLKCPRKEY